MLTADDPCQQAVELAFRYLGPRARTEREVRRHLEQRGVDDQVIRSAIEILSDQGYVDDVRFVHLFAQDKRELEQWGNDRIKRTLRQRGIDREVIDEVLTREQPQQELERALELLRRRFASAPRTRRERDRALGVMLRKGFDSELALEALARYGRSAVEQETQ